MVRVHYSESMAMWRVALVRTGLEGLQLVGRWVGESLLRGNRSEFVRESWMSVPRSAALVSEVCEWALKSPMIMESSWDWRSRSKEGVKVGGQEECGGT